MLCVRWAACGQRRGVRMPLARKSSANKNSALTSSLRLAPLIFALLTAGPVAPAQAQFVCDSEAAGEAGDGAVALGANSTACGPGVVSLGDNSSAFGTGSLASGTGATALGGGTVALGDGSIAAGLSSIASGLNATSLGANSNVSGDNATAVGTGANAAHTNSTAIGTGARTTADDQIAVGTSATTAYTFAGLPAIVGSAVDSIVTTDGRGNLRTVSQISAPQIASSSVTTTKIADGAVTTSKIADRAITTGKIADGAVTGRTIAASAVSSQHIADGAVGFSQLSSDVQNRLAAVEHQTAAQSEHLKELDGGVAMALALSSITMVPGKTLSLGAGVGTFNGEQGAALKIMVAPEGENWVISGGGSVASGGNAGAAMSISFGM